MAAQKSAIITGAASGLGRALALEFARHGWRIAVVDINLAGAEETLAQVRDAGGEGLAAHLDVSDFPAWQALAERLQADWPHLDLLVNNAGFGIGGPFEGWSVRDWKRVLDVNLFGAIYGCRAMLEWLKRNPSGAHIVNVASLAAVASPPGMAPYNVAKAGVLSLSESLYSELRPHRIAVTCVCPAFVPTKILENGQFENELERELAARMMNTSRVKVEAVARTIYLQILRKRLYVFVPGIAGYVWRLKRLLPVWLLNSVAKERQQAALAISGGKPAN
jgi:NAD(P)-dependent dehydrogenase (short-subunit alcohol dehydrogenase family)